VNPGLDGTPIKVLVVDDEGLVRSGFRALLDAEDGIEVVGEATNGAQAVEQARATRPHVVLMDIRMPTMDGIEATKQIVTTPGLQHVRILILTTYDTDAYVFEGLQAGASGFLLKDAGRPSSSTASGSSPPETRCSGRESLAASSHSSPPAEPPTGLPTNGSRCSPNENAKSWPWSVRA
jgi:DNA-binding NarL/FixJ family response regulator